MDRRAYIYAIIAILNWSTVASAFKITLHYINFTSMLFLSSLISMLIFSLYVIFTGKVDMLIKYIRNNLPTIIFLAILNPFLYYLLLFKAYSMVRAQEAMALNYTWPIMVVLMGSIILKNKTGWKSLAALMISFSGVFIILTKGEFSFSISYGDALALSTSIIWAIFWIYSIKVKERDEIKMCANFIFGVFLILPVALFNGLSYSLEGIAGSTYAGIFEMGITFLLWMKALSLSKAGARINNMVYLSPFLSIIIIHFVVGEEIMLYTFTGLIFIIGGILLQEYVNMKKLNGPAEI